MLSHAAKVIATSKNEYRDYKELGVSPAKIIYLGHGINVEEFHTAKNKTECRKKHSIPLNAQVYTYIGRIHSIKGLDLLVQAFAAINKPDSYLILAGSDEGFLSKVKELVNENELQERVKFLGPCFGQQKAEIFRASDVFVYPSRSEGFSLGILEAASVGLPLLITTACHFGELQKELGGIVVHVNSKSLASGLNEMYSLSDKEKIRMGNNAAKLIEREYSMTAINNKLENIYSSLIATIF